MYIHGLSRLSDIWEPRGTKLSQSFRFEKVRNRTIACLKKGLNPSSIPQDRNFSIKMIIRSWVDRSHHMESIKTRSKFVMVPYTHILRIFSILSFTFPICNSMERTTKDRVDYFWWKGKARERYRENDATLRPTKRSSSHPYFFADSSRLFFVFFCFFLFCLIDYNNSIQ